VTRDLLLVGLEDHVSFDKELRDFSTSDSGVTARFADDTSETGSLLIGANGVQSIVRQQKFPEQAPVDTEGRVIYGKTILTVELESKLPDPLVHNTCLIQDRSRECVLSLFLEMIRFPNNGTAHPEDYVYWVLLANKSRFGVDDAELLGMKGAQAASPD
jgi:2-polyprenyl-6-methoxyphenol hydroxylase-like FAD-dependent oxidoreductase